MTILRKAGRYFVFETMYLMYRMAVNMIFFGSDELLRILKGKSTEGSLNNLKFDVC